MTKLDFKQPYGVVYGDDTIKYTQGGKHFNARAECIEEVAKPTATKVQKSTTESVKPVTPVENAKAFLLQILKENGLSKAAVYKESENNNYNWDHVRDAALNIGVIKFSQKNIEMWKLPEGAL